MDRVVVHNVDEALSHAGAARHAGRMKIAGIAVLTALTALAGSVPAAAAPREFGWPLHPRPTVARPFDGPEHDWLPGHRGADLTGRPGQPVLAAGAGVVVFAGTVAGKPVVSVAHAGGLRTTYEPVTATVTAGRRVERGDPLGTLEPGHEGCRAPACLHWGLRRDRDDYLDPLPLVRSVIRLQPVSRRPRLRYARRPIRSRLRSATRDGPSGRGSAPLRATAHQVAAPLRYARRPAA